MALVAVIGRERLQNITAGRRKLITRGVADPSSKVINKSPMFSYINQSIDTGAIAILHAALLLASYTKWQILPNAGDPPGLSIRTNAFHNQRTHTLELPVPSVAHILTHSLLQRTLTAHVTDRKHFVVVNCLADCSSVARNVPRQHDKASTV